MVNFSFIPLISSLLVLSLGFFVFTRDRSVKLNKIFFFFTIAAFTWLFGTFMLFQSDLESKIILWDKIIYSGVIFIPILGYHFGLIFIEQDRKNKVLLFLGYFLALFFLLVNFSTTHFIDEVYYFSWGTHSRAGIFHHFFLLFFVFYIFQFFYKIYIFYRNSIGLKREQAKYIFLALFSLSFGSFALFSAYGIDIGLLIHFSYASGTIFMLLLAYSIIRHRLMDIKFVLRKSSVYGVSLLVIIALVATAKFFVERARFSERSLYVVDFAVLVAAVLIFPFIKEYFYKIANKYFFTNLYDSRKVISQISDKLSSTLDVQKIHEHVCNSFLDAFNLESFGIVMLDKKKMIYEAVYNRGFKIGRQKMFSANKSMDKVFLKKGTPIVIEEMKGIENEFDPSVKKTLDMLTGLGVEVLAPLKAKNELIGLLVLGRKESGDMFNDVDLELLKIVGTQAAISIENAKLYGEAKKFNLKLKREVKKATKDLQDANLDLKEVNSKLEIAYEKLRKLDRAKSEFLSIASHQLRTPLTSIKGFTSLLLEGTYGEMPSEVRTTLEKIFISNERMIKLVEDFLNITRIESGRFVFELKSGRIDKLVDEVVDSMKIAAKNKKLFFEYKKSPKGIEPLVFDWAKIREVVSNLIDNSIKYTSSGTVSVLLKEETRTVKIIIQDTGAGIRKGELEYIFERFQRGKDINEMHTEGIGLGLYVCRKIMDAHKGKIWAESDGLGKGSRFIVELKKNLKIPQTQKKA